MHFQCEVYRWKMLLICASELRKMKKNKMNCLIITNSASKHFRANNFVDKKDKNMDYAEQFQCK